MWFVLVVAVVVILDLYANRPILPVPVARWLRTVTTGRGPATSGADAEATLASALLAGRLPAANYRRAMERVAVLDVARASAAVPESDR